MFQDSASHVAVQMFNVYDNAARLLWRCELVKRGPLAPDDRRRLHVVIEGLGELGEAVLLRVLKSGHFANGRNLIKEKKPVQLDLCRDLRRSESMSRSLSVDNDRNKDRDDDRRTTRIKTRIGTTIRSPRY